MLLLENQSPRHLAVNSLISNGERCGKGERRCKAFDGRRHSKACQVQRLFGNRESSYRSVCSWKWPGTCSSSLLKGSWICQYFILHDNFIVYQNSTNTWGKRFLSKIHASRVGEKATQTRWLTSDISTYKHSTLLQPYFTLSMDSDALVVCVAQANVRAFMLNVTYIASIVIVE